MIASFLRKLLHAPHASPHRARAPRRSFPSSARLTLSDRCLKDDNDEDDAAEGHVTSTMKQQKQMHSAKSSDDDDDEKEEKNSKRGTRTDAKTALALLPNNMRVERKLASGAYSDVWRVVDNETKTTFAVKTMHPGLATGTNESAARRARRAAEEDILWSKLDHENVLKRHVTYVFEQSRATVMAYCNGGDLFRWLERNVKTTGSFRFDNIDDSAHVIEHLFRALDYLHNTANMMHRDVKPENILVHLNPKKRFCDSRLLLGDFTFLTPIESVDARVSAEACGTREYVAPEVYNGLKYGCAVDCWSAGVVCYECIEGEHPFVDDFGSEDATQRALLNLKAMKPMKNTDARMGEVYIVSCLLRNDVKTRMTAREVLDYCTNGY